MGSSPRQSGTERDLAAMFRRNKDIISGMFHVITRDVFRSAAPYAKVRFGFLQRLLFIACQDASYVEKFHLRINFWSDKEVMAWKDSLITNCNSVSIAVSFILFPELYYVLLGCRFR